MRLTLALRPADGSDVHQLPGGPCRVPVIAAALPPGVGAGGGTGRGRTIPGKRPSQRPPRTVSILNRIELLPPLPVVAAALAIVLVLALVLWRLRVRARRLAAEKRAAGYQLMDCLKAYTAWIDWHRDEPLLQQDPEALSQPAALAQAVQIKERHFPELSRPMVQLLQSHGELMKYLWEDHILRMTQSGSNRPHYADPQYHQLRDTQDAALDTLFARCRALIGDAEVGWRRTRSDFNFSSSMGFSSSPAR